MVVTLFRRSMSLKRWQGMTFLARIRTRDKKEPRGNAVGAVAVAVTRDEK
jgi:hypothetical protein